MVRLKYRKFVICKDFDNELIFLAQEQTLQLYLHGCFHIFKIAQMVLSRAKHRICIFLLQYQYLCLESALAMMSLNYLQIRVHFFFSLSTLWCH